MSLRLPSFRFVTFLTFFPHFLFPPSLPYSRPIAVAIPYQGVPLVPGLPRFSAKTRLPLRPEQVVSSIYQAYIWFT